MKNCKDCKWDKISMEGWTARALYACYLCMNCGRKKYYWAAKICLLLIVLLFTGCSQHIVTLPDGGTYKANRFLDWTKIGSVSYDDGSFTLEGYESDTSRLIGIVDKLLAEKAEHEKRLIAREEQP